MKDQIDICYITDDNYVQHTVVSIASLVSNKHPTTKYRIFIICNKVKNAKKRLLLAFRSIDNIEINLIDYDNEVYTKKEYEYSKYVSSATYIRLKLPSILPSISKLLYIDGDTLIMDDLLELYNLDLDNKIIAGTIDWLCIADKWKNADYIRNTLPNYEQEYINAGVLLLDLVKLRQCKFEDICQKLYNKRTDFIFADQDIINFALAGKKKIISIYWNCAALLLAKCVVDDNFLHDRIQKIYHVTYDRMPIDIVYKAKIIHLNGNKEELYKNTFIESLYNKYSKLALKHFTNM